MWPCVGDCRGRREPPRVAHPCRGQQGSHPVSRPRLPGTALRQPPRSRKAAVVCCPAARRSSRAGCRAGCRASRRSSSSRTSTSTATPRCLLAPAGCNLRRHTGDIPAQCCYVLVPPRSRPALRRGCRPAAPPAAQGPAGCAHSGAVAASIGPKRAGTRDPALQSARAEARRLTPSAVRRKGTLGWEGQAR